MDGYALLRQEMTSYPQSQNHNLYVHLCEEEPVLMGLMSFQVHLLSANVPTPVTAFLNLVQSSCLLDYCCPR